MTYLEAIQESVKLWDWLVENFPKRKCDHPDYQDEISQYRGECPLCDFVAKVGVPLPRVMDNCIVKRCCLFPKYCDGFSYSETTHYGIWNRRTESNMCREDIDCMFKSALKAAKKIRNKLRREEKKLLRKEFVKNWWVRLWKNRV